MAKTFMHCSLISKNKKYLYKLRYNNCYESLYNLVDWSNFMELGVPNATPTEDVIVAIILSFLSMGLKKYTKL